MHSLKLSHHNYPPPYEEGKRLSYFLFWLMARRHNHLVLLLLLCHQLAHLFQLLHLSLKLRASCTASLLVFLL